MNDIEKRTKMKNSKQKQESVRKLALVGVLTALAAALSFIKIPILGTSITLVLPVVVIGGAICGPLAGAWLTVIPNLLALPDSGIFLANSPAGCVATLLLKGLLAGLVSGLLYKALSKKHPIGAVACSAVVAPVINTAVFVLGCFIFIWDELVIRAGDAGVGIGLLLFGLAGLNFIIELILNVILCPAILRIIQLVKKKKTA